MINPECWGLVSITLPTRICELASGAAGPVGLIALVGLTPRSRVPGPVLARFHGPIVQHGLGRGVLAQST